MENIKYLLCLFIIAVLQCSAHAVSECTMERLITTLEGLREDIRGCMCSSYCHIPHSSTTPMYTTPFWPNQPSTQPTFTFPGTSQVPVQGSTQPPFVSTQQPFQSSITSPQQSVTETTQETTQQTTPASTPSVDTTATSTSPEKTTTLQLIPTKYTRCEDVPISVHQQYVEVIDLEANHYVCDTLTDGGNWTIIQRRYDGSQDFQQTWDNYERGFGSAKGEYWLGLSHLYHRMHHATYEMRIDIWTQDGRQTFANYDVMTISHARENYKINVQGFTGNAPDCLNLGGMDDNRITDGMAFSTFDKDHDQSSGSCSTSSGHGGWWYNDCTSANLNGVWGEQGDTGVYWCGTTDMVYLDMKIRPVI